MNLNIDSNAFEHFLIYQTFLTICLLSSIHYIQESLNKFPDFFDMGTLIDSTHMKL